MDLGLRGRVVLVTGSSSGIGRATAVAFGREGARVAVTYHRNQAGVEETAVQVREAGGEAMVVAYDLADADSIRAAVDAVAGRWGAVDVLVNNAVQWASRGGPMGGRLFEEVPAAEWQAMLRTSLEGAYLTIQAVLPHMRARRWGRIINISSSLAEDGMAGSGAYSAAKAGLHGLTRSLCWELGPLGILTNVVMPGVTVTERAARVLPGAVMNQVIRQTPSGRLSVPEDVANMVLFLGSAANGNVNGEMLRVTGGL